MKHTRVPVTVAALAVGLEAAADFIGISTEIMPGDGVNADLVVNLFADFDECEGGSQGVFALGGIPGLELNVAVNGGTFYSNPLNTNNAGRTAPPQEVVDLFPSVAFDSFVTIGLKTVPAGGTDATGVTPGFPTEDGIPTQGGVWSETRFQLDDAAWFVTPDDRQAYPGQADNPPDRVIVAQFSIAAGGASQMSISGSMVLLRGQHCDGSVFQEILDFEAPLCRLADIDGNGMVGTTDLLAVLAQWGPCLAECPADFRGDGMVGERDLLDVLENWGPCQ